MTSFHCDKCNRTYHLCESNIIGVCTCYKDKPDTSLVHKDCPECFKCPISCEKCKTEKIGKYKLYLEYLGVKELDKCGC